MFLVDVSRSPLPPSSDPQTEPLVQLVEAVPGSYFIDWSFLQEGICAESPVLMQPGMCAWTHAHVGACPSGCRCACLLYQRPLTTMQPS